MPTVRMSTKGQVASPRSHRKVRNMAATADYLIRTGDFNNNLVGPQIGDGPVIALPIEVLVLGPLKACFHKPDKLEISIF